MAGMRPEGLKAMDRALSAYHGQARLLDVGSFDVNGNFRGLVERRGWDYVGLDIAPGPNVDVVSTDPYRFPFEDNAFDVVISGYCMEHVQALWLWTEELARLLKPGGLLVIITHTSFHYHPHPVDCWRVMPDGMKYLFDRTNVLERYDIQTYDQHDILGAAWKVTT